MVDTVRSAQARRQLREPESGRFKDEHKKAGFPNADALEKLCFSKLASAL